MLQDGRVVDGGGEALSGVPKDRFTKLPNGRYDCGVSVPGRQTIRSPHDHH
jgi:hypothetical protein